MPDHLRLGTPYAGSTIVDVLDFDAGDPYQPYLYQLADGRTVWVPTVDEE